MNRSKERFEKLALRLRELGEDKEEMDFWISIFDDLPEKKQEELMKNLKEELSSLGDR